MVTGREREALGLLEYLNTKASPDKVEQQTKSAVYKSGSLFCQQTIFQLHRYITTTAVVRNVLNKSGCTLIRHSEQTNKHPHIQLTN